MTATASPSHRHRASAQRGELPLLLPTRVAIIGDSAIHFGALEPHLRARCPGRQAVEWISDATASLDRAAASAPGLVITDCQLSGHDLLAMLGLLRQRGPSLHVRMMSGRVGAESVVQLLKAGASDFLPKARQERLPLVTARELAEARAQQAQTRLQQQLENQRLISQAVIDQVPVGLWMVSPDGAVEHASPRAAKLMRSLGAVVTARDLTAAIRHEPAYTDG